MTTIIASFMLLLSLVSEVALAFQNGLLPNGDFEQGPQPWQLNGTQALGHDCIPDWDIRGFVEYIPWGHKQGDMVLVVPVGENAVRLGNNASIAQTVTGLTKAERYSITFSFARSCAQQEKINVSASPYWSIFPMQTMYSSTGWDAYAWSWLATSDASRIVVHNPCLSEDPACGPLIDDIAIKQLNPARRTKSNLIKNGDFEEGPLVLPKTNCGVLIPPNLKHKNSPLPGWVVLSAKAVRYINSEHFAIPSGIRAIELLAGRESAIAQVVRTKPGRSYVLSFAVGDARDECVDSMAVEANAGSGYTEVAYESTGNGGSKRAELRFNATETRTLVVFSSSKYHRRNQDFSSLCGPVIDNVVLFYDQ